LKPRAVVSRCRPRRGRRDCAVACNIVGDTAPEIIQTVAVAMKMKATKADFDATFALPLTAKELMTVPTARHVRAEA
jgi:glutathione reductase (NADPH)